MQNQIEEIVLLPTNEGKKHRNENEGFIRLQTSSNDYATDKQHQNIFKR
jgi:hypothetical protein